MFSGDPAKDDKTIVLPRYCQAKGPLIDLDGNPLVDAFVKHGSCESKTDKDGHFKLDKIAMGTFEPGNVNFTIYDLKKTKMSVTRLKTALSPGVLVDLGEVEIDPNRMIEFFTSGAG